MLMCRDLAKIASDYIDGELSGRQNLTVKMHLMMCKDCRTFIGNLRASSHLLSAHSAVIVVSCAYADTALSRDNIQPR